MIRKIEKCLLFHKKVVPLHPIDPGTLPIRTVQHAGPFFYIMIYTKTERQPHGRATLAQTFAPIKERKDMDISRDILQFLHYHPLSSRDEIARGTAFEGSDATMKRLLAAAVAKGDVVVEGKAHAYLLRAEQSVCLQANIHRPV